MDTEATSSAAIPANASSFSPATNPTTLDPDADFVTGPTKRPYAVMLYGRGGIGKTHLAALCPGHVIIDINIGADRIAHARRWKHTPHDLRTLCMAIVELSKRDNVSSIVLDSFTEIEQMAVAQVLREGDKKSIEAFGYGKGYELLKETLLKFLGVVRTANTRGKNVIIIAHERIRVVNDPMHEPYDRFEPDVSKQSLNTVVAFLDGVFFLRPRTIVRGEEDEKAKAIGEGRELYTEERPAFLAKNRFGLPKMVLNPNGDFWSKF